MSGFEIIVVESRRDGPDTRYTIQDCFPDQKIGNLRKTFVKQLKVAPNRLKLLYLGIVLEDDEATLSKLRIRDQDELTVVVLDSTVIPRKSLRKDPALPPVPPKHDDNNGEPSQPRSPSRRASNGGPSGSRPTPYPPVSSRTSSMPPSASNFYAASVANATATSHHSRSPSKNRPPSRSPSKAASYRRQQSTATGPLADIPPSPQTLPPEETSRRIEACLERASRGGYDADVYIADPDAHYSHIEHLERRVVADSEYFRCQGKYDPLDHECRVSEAAVKAKMVDISEESWKELEHHLPASHGSISDALDLRKSYVVVCNTVTSFSILESHDFSNGHYSMLVRHPGSDISELRHVPRQHLCLLKKLMESFVQDVLSARGFKLKDVENRAMELTLACGQVLEEIHFPIAIVKPGGDEGYRDTLAMLRMTALILDLALVAYVGSHTHDFHATYVRSDAARIDVPSPRRNMCRVRCSLQPLACLSGYLDGAPVWVFEAERDLPGSGKDPHADSLSVLTTMKVFADVWGPVWSVESKGRPGVWQYNLTRGCISSLPDAARSKSPVNGAVPCHWYETPQLAESEAPKDPSHRAVLQRDQPILIGARLEPNPHCLYTLTNYERDFGTALGFLGAVPPPRRLGTRPLGFASGVYAPLAMAGTQKRFPAVTLKDLIWTRLNFSPRTASIEFLDAVLGVEISPCTGNARRLRLRELLALPTVQARLERAVVRGQPPDWATSTQWGIALLDALADDDFATLRDLWDNTPEWREHIARRLCRMLELLHYTGENGGGLAAACFSKFSATADRQVELEARGNEWAVALRESPRTATYAVVGETCLLHRGPARGDYGGCNQRVEAVTALQTRLVFPGRPPLVLEVVRLEPSGGLLQVAHVDRGGRIVLRVVGSVLQHMQEPPMTVLEVVDQPGQVRSGEFRALILALTASWGGMSQRREFVFPGSSVAVSDGTGRRRRQNGSSGQARRSSRTLPREQPPKCVIM